MRKGATECAGRGREENSAGDGQRAGGVERAPCGGCPESHHLGLSSSGVCEPVWVRGTCLCSHVSTHGLQTRTCLCTCLYACVCAQGLQGTVHTCMAYVCARVLTCELCSCTQVPTCARMRVPASAGSTSHSLQGREAPQVLPTGAAPHCEPCHSRTPVLGVDPDACLQPPGSSDGGRSR